MRHVAIDMGEAEETDKTQNEQGSAGPKTQESGPETSKSIASRGVPANESLYFPRHDSEELRSFQDKDENPTRNLWNMDELVNFVFSKKYQSKYHEVALAFMKLLAEKQSLNGSDLAELIANKGISKATFYNRVLPRLRRVGMIKIERDTIVAVESKRKFRPMHISLSKTFGNYLMKIGDSWLATVDDCRSRKKE